MISAYSYLFQRELKFELLLDEWHVLAYDLKVLRLIYQIRYLDKEADANLDCDAYIHVEILMDYARVDYLEKRKDETSHYER